MPPPYRNTLNITSSGMRLSTSGKAMAILSICPVLATMVLTPDAVPRWRGGTLLISALTLGEVNSPEPPPISIIHTAISQ